MTASTQRIASDSSMLPLAAAATLYVALVAAAVWHVLAAAGEPVYAMDDVYIHMALAKNLAAHGVYGVTPFEATHASSSPLWVLLLAAGFAVLGPWIWWPGLLAGLSALAVLAVSDRYLRQQTVATKRPAAQTARAGVLCLIVLGASLPPLTLQGMEHPLHAAVTLLAAMLGADAIAGREANRRRDLLLIALCLTLPVLRYESLCLVALLATGLAWRGRYRLASAIAVAAAMSVCLVGFWAMSRGLTFLPAPILAKSVGPFLLSDDGLVRLVARFTWHPLTRIGRVPLLTVLFVAALIYVLARLWRLRLAALDGTSTVMAALFLAGTWAHATFATFGWGSRYEAYLIVLGLASMGGIAIDLAGRLDGASRGPRLAALLAGFAAALTIYTGFGRALETWRNAQYAAVEVLNRDIYVGRFLAAAYPRQPVLAMNIGAVVWEGEPRLLDALALGSPEALRLFLAGKLDPAALDALARQHRVRVLAVFEEWFEAWTGGRPPWIPVAQIDASNERRQLRLTLYVLEKSEGDELAAKLRTIRPSGSFTVRVRILPPYGDG